MSNQDSSQLFDCAPPQGNLEKSVAQRADELLLAEKFAEAEQLYRELCTGLELLLGPAHQDVAEAKHKLAAALSGQGKTDEALESEQSSQILKDALKQ